MSNEEEDIFECSRDTMDKSMSAEFEKRISNIAIYEFNAQSCITILDTKCKVSY